MRADVAPYRAACLQLQLFERCAEESEVAKYRQRARDYLDRTIGNLKRQSLCRPELRLVLVPEFWLSGLLTPANRAFVPDAIPGELSDSLCALAVEHRCFIAANVIEGEPAADPATPRRFFDSAIIASDEGKLVLHYREVAALAHGASEAALEDFWHLRASPPEERARATLPVADTELGRLAVIVGSDIRYGSTPRGYSAAGADVIIHVANEGEWCSLPWRLVKQVRARENRVFLLSCTNAGNAVGISSEAGQSAKGGSRIVDSRGRLLAATDSTAEAIVEAVVDLSGSPERAGSALGARLDRLGIHDSSSMPAQLTARALAATNVLNRGDNSSTVVAELTYQRSAGERLEEVTSLGLRVLGAAIGSADGPTDRLRIRYVEDLAGRRDGRGGEVIDWSASETGSSPVELWSDDEIDFTRSELVSLVAIAISTDATRAVPFHRYRVEALRGGQAVRTAALHGARLMIMSPYSRLGERAWCELVEWVQVLAWESELAVLLLGNRDVQSWGVASPAIRATREVAQVNEIGELIFTGIIDDEPWTAALTTRLDGAMSQLLRGRDQFRRDIDAYASALEPGGLALG